MAVSTSEVTGGQWVDTQVVAASASRTSIEIVNRSGAEVALYFESQTLPFHTMGRVKPDQRYGISGALAALKVRALCAESPLVLTVTTL